jgi:competence protein CoiA
MLVALLNEQRVIAADAAKGPSYCCPGCGEEVILRKGGKVIHHFAHKPPVTCSWAVGETKDHLRAKALLLNDIRARPGCSAQVEYAIGNARADVYVETASHLRAALEIQHTAISPEEISRRTEQYFNLGLATNWLSLIRMDRLRGATRTTTGYVVDRYSPKPFERWLHGFNFGEIWFIDPEAGMLWQGKLSDHMIEKPYSEWYETGGHHQTAGGYSYRSKRWKRLTLTGPFEPHRVEYRSISRQATQFGQHRYPRGQRLAMTVTGQQ